MGLLRRWLGRDRREAAAQTPLRARDVVRAVVLGENVEQVADVVRMQREQREREVAARAEVEADRQRREAGARALRRHVERHGSWFPGDPI